MTLTHSTSSALDKIYAYPEMVLSGEIVACEKIKLACQRFLTDLDRSAHDDGYPWVFDERLAVRPIGFMEQFLAPTKGNYDRMELLPWQCFAEGNMYGWVHRDTRLRRFREALIVVGKGNGKSTMMSGNSTFCVSKDGERGPEVYLLANSKPQAGIVFGECAAQIKASPQLAGRFKVRQDEIRYEATNGVIRRLSTDSTRHDGLNPHAAVFDEIHEYQNMKLINTVRASMKKRAQPLCIYITTMGYVTDGPLVQFYGLFSDAMEEGKLSPGVADRMFCLIYELDRTDDIEDSANWIKANPGLGAVLDLEDMKAEWARARLTSEEKGYFITKSLNIMTDLSDAAYLPWDVIKRNDGVIDLDTLTGRACYGGFDMSTREDFTAASLEFELDDGRTFWLHHSWVTRRKVDRNDEKVDFYTWAMMGYLTIVDGEFIEQDLVFDWFCKMAQVYEIVKIGYDPANAIWLVRKLTSVGFDCQVVRQGPLTLNDPMKDVKERFLARRMVSNCDPMLRWYVSNVRLRQNYQDREKENWMPTKRHKFRKIDGFAACLDAHAVTMNYGALEGEYAEMGVSSYEL